MANSSKAKAASDRGVDLYGGDYYGLLGKGFTEQFACQVYAWERCLRVYRAINAGATRKELAEKFGVNRSRVCQLYNKGERIARRQDAIGYTGGPLAEYFNPGFTYLPLSKEETVRRAIRYKLERSNEETT